MSYPHGAPGPLHPAPPPAPPNRGRAFLLIGGIVAFAVLLLIGLLVVTFGGGEQAPPGAAASPAAPPASEPPAASAEPEGDDAAAAELATRPMLQLPESAALPHALTDDVAGPPIAVPEPDETLGVLVPEGFPATPEGAVGQLIALTQVGLEGGDPAGYAQAYDSVAAPGAPAAEDSRLYRDLQRTRQRAGLPPTGAVPGLTFTWTPTSALIKGSADRGRYVVVCVLGELAVGANGRSMTSGAGDCQAMRRVGDEWRIAPGPAAAPAPLAWPGTAEAVRAGYRDIRR
jgi:hypothetical protein